MAVRIFLAIFILITQLFSNPSVSQLPENPHVHEQLNEQGQRTSFEHTHIQVHEPIFLTSLYEVCYDNLRVSILPSLQKQPSNPIVNWIFRPPIS